LPQPLAGVRVADFTHVMAGPFATHLLSLLGAQVIKVEPPGGDHFRDYDKDPAYAGMSPAFIAANLGKKSIVLDLKQEAGRKAARELIAACDVVVENFRPGVMDRLGLGYQACQALKPDIVFCSVSGYGQSGPRRDYPALDQIVQAASGMMSVNGRPQDPPLRIGFPVVDTYVGTLGAIAILSALLQRERFGGGQRVDVAMFDAALVLLTSAVTPFLIAGKPFPRTGNQGYSREPTANCFETADGSLISLGVTRQPMFEALCRSAGRPDWIADPRFATGKARNQPANAAALQGMLAELFLTRPGEDWERMLSAAGAPCALVRDIAQGLALDQLEGRQVIQPVAIDGLPGQRLRVLSAGFEFDSDGPATAPPPRLGEHTDEVLELLGYDEAGRAELRRSGAAA
jgi:CoA:oxalate CoA-transferase